MCTKTENTLAIKSLNREEFYVGTKENIDHPNPANT